MSMLIVSTGADALAKQVRPHAAGLAQMVVTALIDEATLTPKPGLVDFRGRGAHRDLDWMLMCHSAWALHPGFCAMADTSAGVGLGCRCPAPRFVRDRTSGTGPSAAAADDVALHRRTRGACRMHRGGAVGGA